MRWLDGRLNAWAIATAISYLVICSLAEKWKIPLIDGSWKRDRWWDRQREGETDSRADRWWLDRQMTEREERCVCYNINERNCRWVQHVQIRYFCLSSNDTHHAERPTNTFMFPFNQTRRTFGGPRISHHKVQGYFIYTQWASGCFHDGGS